LLENLYPIVTQRFTGTVIELTPQKEAQLTAENEGIQSIRLILLNHLSGFCGENDLLSGESLMA
jgi:hypothetical protein